MGAPIDIDRLMLYWLNMTAVTVSSKYQIVIPQEARKKLGIKAGMRLQVISEDSVLRLVKEPEIDEIAGLLQGMFVDDAAIRSEEDRVVS
jgi:AbrB family looped-hinge helix DNA binding protein